jgi:uncharacterized protein YndB with AHSA1/START domain
MRRCAFQNDRHLLKNTIMTQFKNQITIARPVSEVYAAFQDLDRLPQWLTGLVRVETIKGTPGEAGYEANYIFEERGKETTFHEVITDVKPMESFTFVLQNHLLTMENTTRLQGQGDHTVVETTSDVTGKSFMMRLFMPLMKGSMRKRSQGDYEKLKGILEG